MSLVSKEDRADELLEEKIPKLEEEGNGQKLEAAYRELLGLSKELVEEHNRYSWEEVPDQCRARLYELEKLKAETKSPENQPTGKKSGDNNDDVQVVDDEDYETEASEQQTNSSPEDHENSNLFEVIKEDVTFDDIVGLEDTKWRFKEKVEGPFKSKEDLKKFDLNPPSGILLRGPPGVGKTMICVATANEIDANVLKIKGSDVVSKYVGEPQENVNKLFDAALDLQPCIIVFDEIDALLTERGQTNNPTGHDQMVNEFLSNMSELGYEDDVFLVGTTNKADKLDEAATRPGRLDKEIDVGLPNMEERRDLLTQVLASAATNLREEVVDRVAEVTRGYSFADIEHIKEEAGWIAKRESADSITDEHLVRAFHEVDPSPDQDRWEMPEN